MVRKSVRILRLMVTITALASAMPVSAYVSDDVEYDISCNPDGYVLTSRHPVSRMVTTPVDAEPEVGIEKIYFGKSCDAFHKLYGKGKWCWANGGFLAEFPARTFGFGRQELSCPGAEAYQGNCGCP